jgi:hypothetical protein
MTKIVSFVCCEDVGIGISNPGTVTRISGSVEDMERLIAYALQSGIEVSGLLSGECEKYLSMDLASEVTL